MNFNGPGRYDAEATPTALRDIADQIEAQLRAESAAERRELAHAVDIEPLRAGSPETLGEAMRRHGLGQAPDGSIRLLDPPDLIAPFIWLHEWCRADDRRSARLSVDEHGRPEVTLDFRPSKASFNEQVNGIGVTYDDALLAARDALPDEVRR